MGEKYIGKRIQEYRAQILEILCELIAIPTVNPPGKSYRQCVNYLSRKLRNWGLSVERVHQTGDRENPEL